MAFLILEDGTIFEGVPFGAKRDIIGAARLHDIPADGQLRRE